MACSCASAINAEMKDWIKLGGGNSGCCGNAAHTYGFHRPANEIPVTDYSRRRESARPVNMNWACAGDFGHSGRSTLRALHATVLTRLMRGELPMICEFIGQPWADKPVYYWARWNGVKTLQRYTGDGHDTWSHISWWRSRADQRAYLYVPAPGGTAVKPVTPSVTAGTVAPAWPGYVLAPKDTYDANVRTLQGQLKARGFALGIDGFFGPQTTAVVKAAQKAWKLEVDGLVGQKTWKAAWTSK